MATSIADWCTRRNTMSLPRLVGHTEAAIAARAQRDRKASRYRDRVAAPFYHCTVTTTESLQVAFLTPSALLSTAKWKVYVPTGNAMLRISYDGRSKIG